MEIIDWDQLALSAAERDLAGIVREIAARYERRRLTGHDTFAGDASASTAGSGPTHAETARACAPAVGLDWRTLLAIADEAEADLGLHARHEAWVLASVLRLPGDEALRRAGELPALDAPVDLQWPDAPTPAVFRAIVAAFAGEDLHADEAAAHHRAGSAAPPPSSALAGGPQCTARAS